jgi:hypothetical protein
LKGRFLRAGAERRGMPDLARYSIARERPFGGADLEQHGASGHAAVWADFDL